MNQEIVMMFNSDEVEKMAATAENEDNPEGVIAVFYDEMQRSIQVDENNQIVVNPQQLQNSGEFVTFKDASDLATDAMPQEADNSQMDQEPMLIGDENQGVEMADQDDKVKDVDTWDISLLDNTNGISQSTEPTVEADNQTCQLWECPKCTALFRDKDVCEQHIEKAHTFTCGLCNEPFEEKDNFELHIIKHISEVPGHVLQKIDGIVQDDSNASLSQESLTKSDVPMGNGEAPSPEKSPATQAVATSAKVEPASSTSLKDEPFSKFICSICDRDCFTNNALMLHMKKKHSNFQTKDHVCDECGKRFRWKLSLENHKTIHHKRSNSGLTVYSCHICGEEYTVAAELDKHLSTHKEANHFTCDFCGAKYKTSTNLLNHIKANHPEGQEFNCKECFKTFKNKVQLESHVAEIHNVKELTKCRFCQKLFESADDMNSHVRTFHLRKPQKLFDCDYCTESFPTTKELSQHMEIHLPSLQKFECNLCNETFSHKETFKQHLKMKHQ